MPCLISENKNGRKHVQVKQLFWVMSLSVRSNLKSIQMKTLSYTQRRYVSNIISVQLILQEIFRRVYDVKLVARKPHLKPNKHPFQGMLNYTAI